MNALALVRALGRRTSRRTARRTALVATLLGLAASGAAAQDMPSIAAADADCAPNERVDERFANGARWALCVESRVRENLVLKHVTYTPPGGEPFPVLASASLAQLHVAYDDNDVTYNDITQYGLGGGYLVELDASDCPYGELMDVRTRPAICRWRRTGGDGYRSAARALEKESVNLFSVSQVGAYAYVQSWTFHDDGTIEPGIGATGALQRSSDDTALPFGRVLAGDPDTLWLSHTHNYHWRLDFDVGAQSNDDTVTETSHPLGVDGRRARTTQRFDTETARRIEPTDLQAWHIWENAEGDGSTDAGVASGRGYRIEPERGGHRFERTDVEPHTGFDVFVTVARDCERFASQNARYEPDCLNDVLQYTDAESLVGADLVLWHRVGFHHVPRDEDQRHMHTHWDGFRIDPVNIASSGPALAVPGNMPPVLAMPEPRSDVVGDTVDVRLSASDPDGDTLRFSADRLPPGVRLSVDGTLSGELTAAGNWQATVRADDGSAFASGTLSWQVADVVASSGEARRRGRSGGSSGLALLLLLGGSLLVRRGRR